MNIVSNHNRLLRGAPVYTAGGDMFTSGLEYEDGKITGYSGSAFGPDCPCDSAAIVDSAFDKSTAWVEEQNYLTAHQDVTNLPYVQNSSLEFNGALISGISGSGFYAVSADNANYADQAGLANSASESERAISATVSQEAVHAGSADYSREAFHSTSADIAEGANHAESADFVLEGWEYNENNNITGYNGSAFAGGQGGQYEGISPIVVNNDEMKISAESARLGVQDPLYFVEDSQTATVIGIHDSAFPEFETTQDGQVSSVNGSAIYASNVPEYSAGDNIDITNHVISVTGSVPSADRAAYAVSATSAHFSHSAIEAGSADSANYATESNHSNSSNSATYDSLGRKIIDTYLTAHQELPDWTPTIQNASGNAYNSAVNWVVDQHYLTAVTGDNTPYSAGANIDITNHVVSGKDWTTEIQNASSYAYEQATAQIPDVSDLPYVQNSALEFNGTLISGISGSGFYATSADNAFEADHAYEADYVLSGWEYDDEDRISGYKGSAFAGQGGQGVEYEGILPIVVNNVEHKISAQSARLGVQEPLYFVEDSNTATVIGISGLPEVEGVMYESGLGLQDGYITSYNNSAFSAERAGYAVSATSANGAISSQTATIVTGGWEFSNGKITGYNGSAVSAGTGHTQVPVSGVSGISITKPGDTVLISVTGQYIPYTNITTGDSGTTCYIVNSGIRTTAASGWVEMYPQNKEHQNEAHLQVAQNYQNSSFWAEIDGAEDGFFQMNWNSGNISPNDHNGYDVNTTAKMDIGNGWITYSANDGTFWTIHSGKVNNWNSVTNTVSSNSANWGDVPTKVVATSGDATGSNILYIVTGS